MNVGIILTGAAAGFVVYTALSYADARLKPIRKFSFKLELLAVAIATVRPVAILPALLLLMSLSSYNRESPLWWLICVPPLAWFAGHLLGDRLAGGRLWKTWR